jgi:hypothetical protein
MGVELKADLSVVLGSLAERLEKDLNRFDQLFARYPYPLDWEVNADATAATFTILPLLISPVPAGRIFDVRRVAISAGGTSGDPFTTLAGATAVLAKGSLMAFQGAGSSSQGRGFTSSSLDGSLNIISVQGQVPNTSTFARGTIALKPGDQFFVIVKGAASGTHLYAVIGVESYLASGFLQP